MRKFTVTAYGEKGGVIFAKKGLMQSASEHLYYYWLERISVTRVARVTLTEDESTTISAP